MRAAERVAILKEALEVLAQREMERDIKETKLHGIEQELHQLVDRFIREAIREEEKR